MVNLKELIQKAKNSEISWDTEIKLGSRLVINKPLKNVSLENWKKIRYITPGWSDRLRDESLMQQIEIKNSDESSPTGKLLEQFKEYVDNDFELETNQGKIKLSEINEDDIIKDDWNNIVTAFKKGHKICGRGGDSCAFQNRDALHFLQQIINDNFLSAVEYQGDEIFKLEEWRDDNNEDELDVEAEISIDIWKPQLLNEDFSEDEKREIEELDISDKNLVGELDLSEFPNLKKLDCSYNQITNLKLSKDTNLLYLDCSHNKLKGKLDLTGNSKLTGLDCSFNELEELAISNCPDLEMLVCNDNKLRSKLKKHLLDNLNPDKLVCLNISDNNLQGDLSNLKNFTKLELLWIGSEDEDKIRKGIYNKFCGSLESLKGFSRLKSFHVSNTDIDVYSDCLPGNAEIIKKKLREKPENSSPHLTKLKEELEILKRKVKEVEEQQALIEVLSK